MEQIKRRILNIAFHDKPSTGKKVKGYISFLMIILLLIGFIPFLSANGTETARYQWHSKSGTVSTADLSSFFEGFEGCFVLYDMEADQWCIYNRNQAVLRISPDSTYKIYDALLALEEGVITPENSLMAWNHTIYPFSEWNHDQDLQSAMAASVNWYFQSLDEQIGTAAIKKYLEKIGYGNKNVTGDPSTYWLESSLLISPVEQVELLTAFYSNRFLFQPENIAAVRDAIRLSSSEWGTLYGKTGTGRVNDQDVNGWFIGYIEGSGHTYFFAVNIQADAGANGSQAAAIALSVLADMNIWK